MNNLRAFIQLDPDVVFLNNGSFGATPLPVFAVYQEWQRHLERQPVLFLGRELGDYLQAAREVFGRYVNSSAADLVFVPNATYGVNVVARSLDLGPGDEVLTTNHEYGACNNIWGFLSRKQGFSYVEQPIPLPVKSDEEIVEQFWRGVTPYTKVIFMSHITSPTAVTFPIAAICQRAREAGILTVIDGAHAPGQLPLDMAAIGADFYTGNAHKWLCSPKGAAFLYARPEQQHLIEPVLVSWGWGEHRNVTYGSDFLDYLQWTGTNDPAAYLSVPAAIAFQEEHNWTAVRQQCHQRLSETIQRLCDLTGLAPRYSQDSLYAQLAIAPLPAATDIPDFKTQLYDQFRVEVPCFQWQDQKFIRVSVQGYNTQADLDTLIEAVSVLLSR
jgi:isopenicillin-N epimerase